MAKVKYLAMRRPLALFEERVVARYWQEEAFFRLGFERFLGSLDEFAGWLLADDAIFERGQTGLVSPDLMSNPSSRRFPVTVTHRRVTRCPICHRTVACRPATSVRS